MHTNEIVTLAETYRLHCGRELSTISTKIVNDGKRLDSFKTGSGCTLKTYARFVQWFSDNWPADLEWPRQIPRPSKSKEAA